MAPRVQIKRTAQPNNPPSNLTPGELSIEMANPLRLWVGVPLAIDPTGRRLLLDGTSTVSKEYVDAQIAAVVALLGNYVQKAGDSMYGTLNMRLPPATIAIAIHDGGVMTGVWATSGFMKVTGDIGIGALADGTGPRVRFQDNGWTGSAVSVVYDMTNGQLGFLNEQTSQYAAMRQDGTFSVRVLEVAHDPLYVLYSTGGHYYLNAGGGVWHSTPAGDITWTVGANVNIGSSGPTGDFAIRGANASKATAGDWLATSDERIKTVVENYTLGLPEILNLIPVRYQFKGNESIGPLPSDAEQNPPYNVSPHGQLAYQQKQYVGLIAQQVEQHLPETVSQHSGYIDNEPVTDFRAFDSSTLIYALINAVKELSARVEQLEKPKG